MLKGGRHKRPHAAHIILETRRLGQKQWERDEMYRFGEFTSKATMAINLAIRIAGELGHTYVGSEHLLWGLCGEGSGVAACVLLSEK